MENSQEIACAKNLIVWILALAALLFIVLSFVPATRQGCLFPHAPLCDYRTFILPTINRASPYRPDKRNARDACYPPSAYCAIKALSSDKGGGWRLTQGQVRLLASIFVMQLLGALLLVGKMPDAKVRAVAVFAIMMSPACICSGLSVISPIAQRRASMASAMVTVPLSSTSPGRTGEESNCGMLRSSA